MKSKRSPAPDSSMKSMQETCCSNGAYGVETVDSDEKYTHAPDWQMNLNRPTVNQDAAATNVDAAFNAGLVLRQKL